MFNFYFYYYKDNSDTLVPIFIGSFLGFLGGLIIYFIQRWIEKNNKNRDLLFFLKASLNQITKPTLVQVDSFNDLISQLNVEKVMDLKLKNVSNFDFGWYDAIDKMQLRKLFFEKLSNKDRESHYFDFVSRINLLITIKEHFIDDYNKILTTDNKFQEIYDDAKMIPIKEVTNILAKSQTRGEGALTSYETEILNATSEWFQIDDLAIRNDMFTTQSLFIKKYEEVNVRHLKFDTFNEVNKCNYAFSCLKKNHSMSQTLFNGYAAKTKESIEQLNKIVEKFK